MYNDLTIISKAKLEELERKADSKTMLDYEPLEIKDIENIDAVLKSVIVYLKNYHWSLVQQKIDATSHEDNLKLVWWMNALFWVVENLEQQKLTALREQYRIQKEKLDKKDKKW